MTTATIRQIRAKRTTGTYGCELEAIYHVVRPGLVEYTVLKEMDASGGR